MRYLRVAEGSGGVVPHDVPFPTDPRGSRVLKNIP